MAPPHDTNERGVTIRRLGEADTVAIRELAGRDSIPVPGGELLGLEIEGRLLAIQPLAEGGAVIADPFARTGEVQALLELRAAQLRARAQHQSARSRPRRLPEHALSPLTGFARAS
jgi:hypothetical protein